MSRAMPARVQRRRRRQAERNAGQLLRDLAARLRERALDEATARYENDRRIPPFPHTDPPTFDASREETTIHPI